jgi:hypothetical protein
LVVVSLVVMLVAALVPQLMGVASARTSPERLAKLLLRRDPGKRVGGETLVGTKTGAVLRGARGRINFMMALGDREVLIGGNSHDELGAYLGTRGVRIHGGGGPDLIHGMGLAEQLSGGPGNDLIYGGPGNDTIRGGTGNDTIYGGPGNDKIYGGSGNDTIYGGAGRDTIYGGGGNDRLVDHRGATTVVTGPGRALVDVRDGRGDDRVMCSPGGQTNVRGDRGDRLSRGCHRMPAGAVRQFEDLIAPQPVAHVAEVSGDGSGDNPYTQPCPLNGEAVCSVLFPPRTLEKLWSNEYVPAYGCPYLLDSYLDTYSFLYDKSYAPPGTTLPDGVGVLGLGPIGVTILATSEGGNNRRNDADTNKAGATRTGFGTSATNWGATPHSYTVGLNCIADDLNAYLAGGLN